LGGKSIKAPLSRHIYTWEKDVPMKKYSDIVLALGEVSPAASPHWRWSRAAYAAKSNPRHPISMDDASREAQSFIRGEPQPIVAAAKVIFDTDDQVRWFLEAHVLADVPGERIAQKVGIDPAVEATYEKLFFDARSYLDAIGWVAIHVLGPEHAFDSGRPDTGTLWRRIGYSHGEQVLDLAYAVTTGKGADRYTPDKIELAREAFEFMHVIPQIQAEEVLEVARRMLGDSSPPRERTVAMSISPMSELAKEYIRTSMHVSGDEVDVSHNAADAA
jgi:hypothetical protein